ncbi:MAG: hypothetical protein AAGG08_08215 [Actinomycetota bacterium]
MTELTDTASRVGAAAADRITTIDLSKAPDVSDVFEQVGSIVVPLAETVTPVAATTLDLASDVAADVAVITVRGGRRLVRTVRRHPRPALAVAAVIAIVVGALVVRHRRADREPTATVTDLSTAA